MTPFDPVALLAMLLAFYPDVSVAALQRARRERPEYFAAGTLGGSKGEKLFLPDGRVFDLIFAAGGPASAQRWQALEVPAGTPDDGDPFPLEAGPLAPLDVDLVLPPPIEGGFVALVAGELAAFGASDEQLARAGVAAAEFQGVVALDAAFHEDIEPATTHHQAMRAALDLDDPAPELEASGLTLGTIDAAIAEYEEPPPDELDDFDPGPRPRDEDDGPPPRIPPEHE